MRIVYSWGCESGVRGASGAVGRSRPVVHGFAWPCEAATAGKPSIRGQHRFRSTSSVASLTFPNRIVHSCGGRVRAGWRGEVERCHTMQQNCHRMQHPQKILAVASRAGSAGDGLHRVTELLQNVTAAKDFCLLSIRRHPKFRRSSSITSFHPSHFGSYTRAASECALRWPRAQNTKKRTRTTMRTNKSPSNRSALGAAPSTAQGTAPSTAQRSISSSCADARRAFSECHFCKRLTATRMSARARTLSGFELLSWESKPGAPYLIRPTNPGIADSFFRLTFRKRIVHFCGLDCTLRGGARFGGLPVITFPVTNSETIMITSHPPTDERTHQPAHEPMNPPTHQPSNTQFVSLCAKAPCARRKQRQIKTLRRRPQWRALSPGDKKRQTADACLAEKSRCRRQLDLSAPLKWKNRSASKPSTFDFVGELERCAPPPAVVAALLLHRFCFVNMNPKGGPLPHRVHFAFMLAPAAVALGRDAPPDRVGQGAGQYAVGVGLHLARHLLVGRQRLRRHSMIRLHFHQRTRQWLAVRYRLGLKDQARLQAVGPREWHQFEAHAGGVVPAFLRLHMVDDFHRVLKEELLFPHPDGRRCDDQRVVAAALGLEANLPRRDVLVTLAGNFRFLQGLGEVNSLAVRVEHCHAFRLRRVEQLMLEGMAPLKHNRHRLLALPGFRCRQEHQEVGMAHGDGNDAYN